MVSAKQLPADRKQSFLAGTDDFMTKPVDEEKLLLRIRALLRRAKIINEHKIIIEETTLDYTTMSVSKNGKTQVLPQKEFLLLYKLLSYPWKIFTRIRLMDEIWGVNATIKPKKMLPFIASTAPITHTTTWPKLPIKLKMGIIRPERHWARKPLTRRFRSFRKMFFPPAPHRYRP